MIDVDCAVIILENQVIWYSKKVNGWNVYTKVRRNGNTQTDYKQVTTLATTGEN